MPHDQPTEHDKYLDLKTQYLRFKGVGAIFCPWCLKGNNPGEPACCALFTDGVDRIGKEQFQSVLNQWRKIVIGVRKHLNCPYCGATVDKPSAENHPADWIRPLHNPFCCDNLSDCVTAILERKTLTELISHKKRVEDAVARN